MSAIATERITHTRRIVARFSTLRNAISYNDIKAAQVDLDLLRAAWCVARQINGIWYIVNLETRHVTYLSKIGCQAR